MFKTLVLSIGHTNEVRSMSEDQWIDQHASGTLRKNKRLGFAYRDQYIHERVCFEFGSSFEFLPATRVTIGQPITDPDCGPVTEAGWNIDRYITRSKLIARDDQFMACYLIISYANGKKREGIGLFCKQTTATFLGIEKNCCLVAIVTEYCPTQQKYLPCENPA